MTYTASLQGLTIGQGTVYPWAAWPSGIFDTPTSTPSDVPRANQQGVFAQSEWMNGRLVVFDFWVIADSISQAEQLIQVAKAAFAPTPNDDPVTLTLEMTNTPTAYVLFGKPRGVVSSPANMLRRGKMRVRAEFLATDPRLYASTATVISTGVATSVGGLTFPASAPFVFGSAGTGGVLDATNTGTFETPYSLLFTGPLTAPAVSHLAQSRTLNLSGASLAAGETLVVDSTSKTVLLSGTASRYSWLANTSQWFTLAPGANSLRFTAASGTGTCQISYRNAWI